MKSLECSPAQYNGIFIYLLDYWGEDDFIIKKYVLQDK